jgi:transcriptional regulator with XRE-family HTH domain
MDKDKILIEFGEFIRIERVRRRLSQEKLAEKASLHRNCIGPIERGESNPTLITILKLAKALEMEPHKLLLMFSQDE